MHLQHLWYFITCRLRRKEIYWMDLIICAILDYNGNLGLSYVTMYHMLDATYSFTQKV